jgi:hypothetical protein
MRPLHQQRVDICRAGTPAPDAFVSGLGRIMPLRLRVVCADGDRPATQRLRLTVGAFAIADSDAVLRSLCFGPIRTCWADVLDERRESSRRDCLW